MSLPIACSQLQVKGGECLRAVAAFLSKASAAIPDSAVRQQATAAVAALLAAPCFG